VVVQLAKYHRKMEPLIHCPDAIVVHLLGRSVLNSTIVVLPDTWMVKIVISSCNFCTCSPMGTECLYKRHVCNDILAFRQSSASKSHTKTHQQHGHQQPDTHHHVRNYRYPEYHAALVKYIITATKHLHALLPLPTHMQQTRSS